MPGTDKRIPLLQELLDTERTHVSALEHLSVYQNELIAGPGFSRDLAPTLFANLPQLLDFSKKFLKEMEETLILGPNDQRVGDVFLRNEKGFSVYFPFCRNYQNAIKIVLIQGEELLVFDSIIPPQQLQSFLIKPLQRLMKYPLLLKELVKLTGEGNPFLEELQDAADAMKSVVETLNELQRRDENERLKKDFMDRLDDWREMKTKDLGDLLLMEEFPVASNDQEKDYHMLLFEHIFVCCKKDTKRGLSRKRSDGSINQFRSDQAYSFVLRGNIELNSIIRVEDTSDQAIGSYSIKVHWKDASEPEAVMFSMKCINYEQVTLWKTRMERQIEIEKRRASFSHERRRKNSYAPITPLQDNYMSAGSSYGNTSPFMGPRSLSNPNNQNPFADMMLPGAIQGFNSRSDIPSVPQIPAQFHRMRSFSNFPNQIDSPSSANGNGVGMRRESNSGVQVAYSYQGFNGTMVHPSYSAAPLQQQPQIQQGFNSYQYPSSPTSQPTPYINTNRMSNLTATHPTSSAPALRRVPTAPSSLHSQRRPSVAPQQSSFIKIRAHIGDDVLVAAMPVKDATLQELHTRIERKLNMMRLKTQFLKIILKEEVPGSNGREWEMIRELTCDEDVVVAVAKANGDMQAPEPIEDVQDIQYNPISPSAMQKNNHIILYARSTLALSCGAAAGILGLTGTTGFIFFILASVAMSLALVIKTGMQPDRYFPMNNGLLHVLTAEVLNSLFSYMLFWTLFTGLVHLFE
ncbi:hypothetical protein BDR26DRAFT_1003874 [Obelidium mucronatum]|nr:hypothetical protein BDR26DRAFT_1003874 [Obelidium mucronatum]